MLQVRERTVHQNIAVINQKSTNTCDVVYAALCPSLPLPLPLSLPCCCVCAACLYLLQVRVFAKLLHLTWLNIPLSTYYTRGTSRELRRDRIRTQSKPIPMSSHSARCPPNVLRIVSQLLHLLQQDIAGHSFLRSQWAIPVSALVCSTLTCRINVSGYNVVVCCTARRAVFVIFNKCKNSTNARYLWWHWAHVLISINGAFCATHAIGSSSLWIDNMIIAAYSYWIFTNRYATRCEFRYYLVFVVNWVT